MFARFLAWLKSLFYNKELQACLIGLQNAGKTTLTNALCNDPDHDNTIPTIGFNVREVKKGKVNLHLWDLGGQNKFRNLWERYCNDANCIVYVVDASAKDKMGEAKEELFKLLEMDTLAGKPLLVLGNKNDLEGAFTTEQLETQLDLAKVQNREVCVYSISAKNQTNLDNVVKWLTQHGK